MSEGSRTGRWSGTDLGQVEGGLGRLSRERTAAEGVRKREPSYTVGEKVNLYQHYGEQHGGS